ncbi:hypothetical protein LOD99_9081 [Oopsacas minuta]|uniref:Uncharacterized protein n=1 Tax=Oopsacas minuta TaxID=111878 RepID=A0AAV7JDJ4_9METZ|nr:hypothetical protein LOD99_9081 [Oopsacas minuta]
MAHITPTSFDEFTNPNTDNIPIGQYQLRYVTVKQNMFMSSAVRSISIDDSTSNLFITASTRGTIYVCNINGELLYHFGSRLPLTELRNPWYNCIFGDLVYVSDYSTSKASIYTTGGDIITSFTELCGHKLKRPNGILIEPSEGDLILCDTDENVVLITHCNSMGLITTIRKDVLAQPYGIRLVQETIFVLGTVLNSRKIVQLSLSGEIHRIITMTIQSVSTYFFEIGEGNDIIICDNNWVYILDSNGLKIASYANKSEGYTESSMVKYSSTQLLAIRVIYMMDS